VERLAASGRIAGSYVKDVSYAPRGIALLHSESASRHALVARNLQNSAQGVRPDAGLFHMRAEFTSTITMLRLPT
jgi:hypothetical protein